MSFAVFSAPSSPAPLLKKARTAAVIPAPRRSTRARRMHSTAILTILFLLLRRLAPALLHRRPAVFLRRRSCGRRRVFFFPLSSITIPLFYFPFSLNLYQSFFVVSLRTLAAISSLICVMNSSRPFCPSSPAKRLLTETLSSSSSFAPTTSI